LRGVVDVDAADVVVAEAERAGSVSTVAEAGSSATSATVTVTSQGSARRRRIDATDATVLDIYPGTVPRTVTSQPATTATRSGMSSRTALVPGLRPATSAGVSDIS
jgi:hypothetical protein